MLSLPYFSAGFFLGSAYHKLWKKATKKPAFFIKKREARRPPAVAKVFN
jgi:hypothetical protein